MSARNFNVIHTDAGYQAIETRSTRGKGERQRPIGKPRPTPEGARAQLQLHFRPHLRQAIDTLDRLMDYVGGWDAPADHPCGQAARLLEFYGKRS